MSLREQLLLSLRSPQLSSGFSVHIPYIKIVLLSFKPILIYSPCNTEAIHIFFPPLNLLNASNRGCYESREASALRKFRDINLKHNIGGGEETCLFIFALCKLPVSFLFLLMASQAHFLTPAVAGHSSHSS